MSSRMWPLALLSFDEGIEADEVYLMDPDEGVLVTMTRAEAMERAGAAGLHLVAEWPVSSDSSPSCTLGRLTLPVRWEQASTDAEPVDEDLWFEAPCGGRDYLVDGCGHTFPGRMSAWCPARELHYNVSLGEMGNMSPAARYFVRGFLSGNEPAPPQDDEGCMAPDDEAAWRAATRRFRRTGYWYGRWSTCEVCGAVLLPDRAAQCCEAHDTGQGGADA